MSALVLSIDQPYASLIMAGVKRYETRPAPPNGDMRPDGVRGLPGARVNRGDRLLIASTTRKPKPGRYGDAATVEYARVGRKRVLIAMDLRVTHHPYPDDSCGAAGHAPDDHLFDLPLGCILGSVTVTDAYPIVDPDQFDSSGYDLPACIRRSAMLDFWPEGAAEEHESTDISDQLPLGDWRPGRWAWALADPVPTTTRCPNDCARFGNCVPGWTQRSAWDWVPCPTCNGSGSCDPVPVTGKQGVWKWTP